MYPGKFSNLMSLPRLLGATYLPISSINIGDRLRRADDTYRKHVEDLAASLQNVGPIHALLVDDSEPPNLIAGGCRIAAYALLGETEVPVQRRSALSEADLKILEMEENIRRKRMKWQDIVLGINGVHERETKLAADRKEDWGLRATGSLCRCSHQHVKTALIIAKRLLAGDEDIIAAPTLEKACEVMLARKEQEAMKSLAARSSQSLSVPLTAKTKPSSIINITLGPAGAAPPQVQVTSKPQLAAYTKIDLSSRLHNVDCLDFMHNQMKAESVDLIVTDIPYGIDMALLEDIHGIDSVADAHDVEENLEQMPEFLKGAYRVLKPNTYLFFFYALQHHEKLREWGKEAGFSVLDWPLLWLKPHSCKNNAPHCNPTKSFEPCYVMRKGKATLAKPMNKCHLEVDGMPDKKNQSNPFAKPLEWLNEMIFKNVAYPSMVMLDPYAGEGSIVRAGILNGCQVIACEKDTDRFPRLVERCKGVYKNMLGANVEFT